MLVQVIASGWFGLMLSAIRRLIRRLRHARLHQAELRVPFDFLGTDYGGWPLLDDTPRGALVYSVGIGEDISFDRAAIERFAAIVHGFDPTPRSMAWIEKQKLPDGFIFHPVGLAAADGELKFFLPAGEAHVSFSAAPAAGQQGRSVTAPARRLATLLQDLATGLPEALKMDIEGFEYAVLEDLVAGELRPRQLLVEFHHDMYGITRQQTLDAVAKLHGAGYKLFYVSDAGREYAFCYSR